MVSMEEVTVTSFALGTRKGWVASIEPPGGKESARLLAILLDRAIGEPTLAALSKLPLCPFGMARMVESLEKGEETQRACAAILIGRLALDTAVAAGVAARAAKQRARHALHGALTDSSARVRAVAAWALKHESRRRASLK